MSRLNSILETLNEDMISVNKVNNVHSKSFMDFIKGKVPKDVEVECNNNLSFKIPSKYKSVLTKKHKPLKRFGKVNVYKIDAYAGDSGALLVEFTDTTLPITVCLMINSLSDRFDVACDKLKKAFTGSVDRTVTLVNDLGYYNTGITYNTVKGNGTFCTEDIEVVESFINAYSRDKYESDLRKYLIDSDLYNYVTLYSIVFGSSLMLHNKPNLRLDLFFKIQSMDNVSKIVGKFKDEHISIYGNFAIITLVLRG